VVGGEIMAAKGYGYADLEARRPVDAETTLFPAMSVSKLFAATAILQLHERRQVDLDADVRRYVPGLRFSEPVTLGQLLTHTAGFDDSYIGFLPRTEDDVVPVEEFLVAHQRQVVRPPGRYLAYSNYGSLLARHVLEVVTGHDYESYLAAEILEPLGMERSCLLPPPERFRDALAMGYAPTANGFRSMRERFPDGLVRFRTHTGTLATTVPDMARFMIAHLDGGAYDGGRILDEATVALMHRQRFTPHPRLPGVTYGFFESRAHGVRGLFHYGGGFGYGTLLYLLPEARVGFYVAHSTSDPALDNAFLAAFLERYFPRPDPAPSPQNLGGPVDDFAGTYAPIRRSESTFEKLLLKLVQVRLTADGPGILATERPWTRKWARSGPDVFERLDGEGTIAFERDAQGRVRTLFLWDAADPETLTFDRVPWYETLPAVGVTAAVFLGLFLSAATGWPLAALRRRLCKRPGTVDRRRLLAGGVGLLHLLFVAGAVWVFASWSFVYRPTWVTIVWLSLPLAAALLTVPLAIAAVRVWREGAWTVAGRVHFSLVVAAAVAFLPFLWHWRLLGFWY